MQIKTITEYHYTPTRVAKIKRLTIHSGDEDLEQPELPYTASGSDGSITSKKCFAVSNKVKIQLHYNPGIPPLAVFPRKKSECIRA